MLAQIEAIVWVLSTVGGLLLLLLGMFFKGLNSAVKDLSGHVTVMQTDMAVVKTTLETLLKRDLVTRGEVNAHLDELRRELSRGEGTMKSLDYRIRSIETGRGPAKPKGD